MFLTEKKLRKRIEELGPCRYRDKRVIERFLRREDTLGIPNPPVPQLDASDEVFAIGDCWTGRDKYLWLQTTLRIPEEWENLGDDLEPVGLFDFGGEFEAMLYIDGEPYHGVDNNHGEVFFRKEHFGKDLTLTFRLWTGLGDGGIPQEQTRCFCSACLALLSMPTDDLYHMGDTMLGTAEVLSEEQEERQELLGALDQAFLLVDWTDVGSVAFYESVEQAAAYLSDAVDKMEKHTKITMSCVGHTHIDTAWMWRLKHTREKASRSFSTVLRLMERFPEYSFMHTQPQQYAYIKEDFPQIYEQIKKREKEGRWEIDGAMWVESDCNLPSGESLTRQFLMGRKFMMEEFGKEPEFLWLPDAFGFSAALPQIMKKSGIETFMTSKLLWGEYNRIPNDTFHWKGIDGSEVLAHFLTTENPNFRKYENYYFIYNGFIRPEVLTGAWKLYQDKKLNQDLLISYGYGDGGGGVSREMLECRRRLDRLPGMPNVKTSSASDYFKRLHKTVENATCPVATWDGELYLELHRGTFTSQAYNKKMNRYLENLYRKAEWLTAMSAVGAKDLSLAQQEQLTEGWKIILTHQFHDVIPGSGIREVYEDSVVNYQEAQKIADEVIQTAYERNSEQSDETYSIVNVVSENRSGLVHITDDVERFKGKTLRTEEGKSIRMQKSEDGVWAYVEDVPAMGVKYLHMADKGIEEICNTCISAVERDGRCSLQTAFYDLQLDENGQMISLYDREEECQVLETGSRGNVLQFFEDKPLEHEAWNIDIFYEQKMQEVTELIGRKVIENGALRAVIRQEWRISKSYIRQDMILYAHSKRIDFKTYVDWQESQKLLKVAFPVDIRANYATYDIQYGNIKRPTHTNTSWERAKFEVVGHRYADLSENDYGVSLLNDCKYGYDVHQNVMRLTLLKSAIYPDYMADKGEHEFTYSLYPHRGNLISGGTVQEAQELNQPLEVLNSKICLPASQDGSAIRLSGAHVELDALKKSEDGQYLVLRFHEYAGSKGKVNVEFGFDVKGICECDLMERPLEKFKKPVKFAVNVRAFEVKTYLLKI